MREGGNSQDGKVKRDAFKRIINAHFKNPKESLIEDLFDRFKIARPPTDTKKGDNKDKEEPSKVREEPSKVKEEPSKIKEEIDLHDFVVSLTVLSRMPPENKIKLIFDLTDVDEDGCLNAPEIYKMINAIERNFARESAYIDPLSNVLLQQLAQSKAKRRFNLILMVDEKVKSYKENEKTKPTKENEKVIPTKESKNVDRKLEDELWDYNDFLSVLDNKSYIKEEFLPFNFQLKSVLLNRNTENKLPVSRQNYHEFQEFRQKLHEKFQDKPDDKNQILKKFTTGTQAKPPGVFEVSGLGAGKLEDLKDTKKDASKKYQVVEPKTSDDDKNLLSEGDFSKKHLQRLDDMRQEKLKMGIVTRNPNPHADIFRKKPPTDKADSAFA